MSQSNVIKVLISILLIRSEAKRKASVAIVGSGLGGASTAYWLQQEFKEAIDITVFERENRVGGRMEHMMIGNNTYELGAAIYVSGNKYVSEFVELMGLESAAPSHVGNTFGLYDGNKILYKSGKLGALLRYGPRALNRLRSTVLDFFGKFEQIYTLQNAKQYFFTPQELWQALGLWNYTLQSFDSFLRHEKLVQNRGAERLIDELTFAMNRVNYNQGNEINALTGSVSMCPAVAGQKVLAIRQGNSQLAQRLLANTTLRLNERVLELTADGDLITANTRQHYDAIILAAPLDTSDITLTASAAHEAYSMIQKYQKRPFQTTYTTFISGSCPVLNKSKLSSLFIVAHMIKPFPASSLSTLGSWNNATSIFKLFSRHPLEDAELDDIFDSGWSRLATKHWPAAYPKLEPFQQDQQLLPFQLSDQLFYVNTLEFATSALEIAAIAGRNVALLTADSLQRRRLIESPSSLHSKDCNYDSHATCTSRA
uniref:Prenylcysteine lyase domain-containing protein n=1 Tax=Aureoumbra lagunensis TaxID=44058 RepID=A0A7S3K3V0_9STRA